MAKVALGVHPYLYPMPVTLVGALVHGKPNYLAVTYCGIVQHDPPMLSISLNKMHYTNPGIREHGTFSVNIPSCDMAQITDYCGIASGRSEDKSELFTSFYGELKTAPMIQECPLNIECRLFRTLDLPGTNEVFIGEVVQAYCEEQYLTGGIPDLARLDPLIFSIHENAYYGIGDPVGHAWQIGRASPHMPRD